METVIKCPSRLDPEFLVNLVSIMQNILFLEIDNNNAPVYNPNKECGADEIGAIYNLFAKYNLCPEIMK